MATRTEAPESNDGMSTAGGGKGPQVKTAYGRRVEQLQRENAALKNEVRNLTNLVSALIEENNHWQSVKRRFEALEKENRTLKAQNAFLKRMLYGPKSEKGETECPQPEDSTDDEPPSLRNTQRPRGQQRGSPGHGRRIHAGIVPEIIIHELPPEQLLCPICSKPYRELPKMEESEEIDWEVRVRRRVHQRKRYRRSCRCAGVPAFITAPSPPKLIPKGILSVGAISHLLLEKFGLGRPVSKILGLMRISSGLRISEGTVAGVMQRLVPLLRPLYQAIIEQSRRARHWHGDETGWKVYEHIKDKKSYNWWLWVFSSADAVVFIIDPSRSREVIKRHLGKGTGPPGGILSSDMFRIYKRLDGIVPSYCWAHMRRHVIDAMQGYRRALDAWGQGWLGLIATLYKLEDERRRKHIDSPQYQQADARLRLHVKEMEHVRDEQMNDPDLYEKGKEVLYTMARHWEGLTVFLDHPQVPLDNNEAERMLRGPVVGRKNYYGSGSRWSGELAAMAFSILATAEKNGLNPLAYLRAYLQACAESGGTAPESIDRFLPWKMSEEDREVLSAPMPRAA